MELYLVGKVALGRDQARPSLYYNLLKMDPILEYQQVVNDVDILLGNGMFM